MSQNSECSELVTVHSHPPNVSIESLALHTSIESFMEQFESDSEFRNENIPNINRQQHIETDEPTDMNIPCREQIEICDIASTMDLPNTATQKHIAIQMTGNRKDSDEISSTKKWENVKLPSDNQLSQFERDPTAALLNFAVNSGQCRFALSPGLQEQIAKNGILIDDPKTKENIDSLRAEINGEAQIDNAGIIFEKFQKPFDKNAPLQELCKLWHENFRYGRCYISPNRHTEVANFTRGAGFTKQNRNHSIKIAARFQLLRIRR